MGQAKLRKAEIEQLKEIGTNCSKAGLVSIVVIRNNRCLVAGAMSMVPNIEQISTIENAATHLAIGDVSNERDQKVMLVAAQKFLTKMPANEKLQHGGFYVIDVTIQGSDEPATLHGTKVSQSQWMAAQL